MNAAIGSRTAALQWRRPRPLAQPGPGAQALEQGRADLEQVADHEQVGELGDRRVGVAIDRDDRARRPHPDLVLDRAADAEREVQLGLDDLAGLADLLAVRDPARIHGGPGRTDRATERLGELLDDPEAIRAADAATAGDDDPGLLDRRGGAGLADPIDDADRGQGPVPARVARLDPAADWRPAPRS